MVHLVPDLLVPYPKVSAGAGVATFVVGTELNSMDDLPLDFVGWPAHRKARLLARLTR